LPASVAVNTPPQPEVLAARAADWLSLQALPQATPDTGTARKESRTTHPTGMRVAGRAGEGGGRLSAAGLAAFARRTELEGSGTSDSGGGQRDGGGHEAHRFHEALRAASASTHSAPDRALTPFELLGSPAVHRVTAADTPVPVLAPDPQLFRRIGEVVERLMVGDGRSGNRQVRMDLKEDLLPGVTVTVQELDGRLEVDFTCIHDLPRQRLADAAPEQAQVLASRLDRDVLLRVQAREGEDADRLEVVATPQTVRRTRS
jgi:hypothetical protein